MQVSVFENDVAERNPTVTLEMQKCKASAEDSACTVQMSVFGKGTAECKLTGRTPNIPFNSAKHELM